MSQYVFELELKAFSQRILRFAGIKPPLLCSRRNVKKWLRQFFRESDSKFSGWRKSCLVDASLSHCERTEGLDKKQSENARILTITVRRHLGNGKWPDLVWMFHSRR